MDILTDSGECAHGNWDCLCSSLGLQQKRFFMGYIWISQYSNCAHLLRILPVLSGKKVCQWRMCLLVWLGAEGSRIPVQGGVGFIGGSYLLNLSVCFLNWLKSSSPYMKGTIWRCDFFVFQPVILLAGLTKSSLPVQALVAKFLTVSSLCYVLCADFFFLVKKI